MELIPTHYEKATEAQRNYIISLTREKFKLIGDITWYDILTTLNNHFKDNIPSIDKLEKKRASQILKELIDLP